MTNQWLFGHSTYLPATGQLKTTNKLKFPLSRPDNTEQSMQFIIHHGPEKGETQT